jgi:predicted hotdog family 3-hydroxylacyl-ACP dehydratase
LKLDRQWLADHIPHHGNMCLLDTILQWDAATICCGSNTHRAADNPLRAHGRLGAACGIEYAAQAMAAHAALRAGTGTGTGSSGGRPSSGFLISARALELHVTRLDDVAAALQIEAQRLGADRTTALYEFSLRAERRLLLAGRATVVLGNLAP